MKVIICHVEGDLPNWLKGHSLDIAIMHIEDGDSVVCARRSDGDEQVVPDGDPLDTNVIANLLKWAAKDNRTGQSRTTKPRR